MYSDTQALLGSNGSERSVSDKTALKERPVYVGRIGNADEFVRQVRQGQIDLGSFNDESTRQEYEFKRTFKTARCCNKIHMKARQEKEIDTNNEERLQMRNLNYPKFQMKAIPRFHFIGRYRFKHQEDFECILVDHGNETVVVEDSGESLRSKIKRVIRSKVSEIKSFFST